MSADKTTMTSPFSIPNENEANPKDQTSWLELLQEEVARDKQVPTRAGETGYPQGDAPNDLQYAGKSWINVPTIPPEEPEEFLYENFDRQYALFPSLRIRSLLLPGVVIIGLVCMAILFIFTWPPGILVAVVLLAVPVWEATSLLPQLTRLEFNKNEIAYVRPFRQWTMNWTDCESIALERDTGLYRANRKLTKLVARHAGEKGVKRSVSLRPYFGFGPQGWGSDLVSIAREAGVEVNFATEEVLSALGGPIIRPTRLSRRERKRLQKQELEPEYDDID